ETKSLTKYFGDTHAIDHVDFSVVQGELLALIGSNGAGKTTLVNLISGLLRADSGTILFQGTDVTALSVHDRIRAGIARSCQLVREGPDHGYHHLDRAVWKDHRGHYRTRHGCRVQIFRPDRRDARRHDPGGWETGRDSAKRAGDHHAAGDEPISITPRHIGMLDLERINTFRGTAHVLQGASLTVNDAEAVCLVGRNGAGKTTTIESIMGLLPVRSGRITFQEREITQLPPHERARLGIGYAPEDAGIFPDLTVAENFLISQWLAGASGKSGSSSSSSEVQDRILAVFPEVRTF